MLRSLLIKYGEYNSHLYLSIKLCSHHLVGLVEAKIAFYGVSGVEIAVRW
jgi:hypothetical protein